MATILVVWASAVPVKASPGPIAAPDNASPGLSQLPNMHIPNVVSYLLVPSAAASRGGSAAHGLVVSLSAATSTVRMKQPMLLTIEISNASSTKQFLFAPNAPCTYKFSITDLSTNKVNLVHPDDCFGDLYRVPIEFLSPGFATRLEWNLENQVMDKPGRYTVTVQSISWYTRWAGSLVDLQVRSNPITIVVKK
jgi:hypothetical protein